MRSVIQVTVGARAARGDARLRRPPRSSESVFADRNRRRDALDLLGADRTDAAAIGERLRNDFGYHAADVVGAGRLFHAGGDIDGIAIDADRSLGIALLADDDGAAMDADAKAGHH